MSEEAVKPDVMAQPVLTHANAAFWEIDMQLKALVATLALLVLAACDSEAEPPRPGPEEPIEGAIAPPAPTEELAEEEPVAWTPDGGLPPFGERTDPNPDRGSWMQQLTPTSDANCRFTERPASERPEGLEVQAWSGNMDLMAEGEVLGHDHAIGFVESFFMADRPVIAVRDGMPDLWIEPLPPREDVTLRIGADEFVCVR